MNYISPGNFHIFSEPERQRVRHVCKNHKHGDELAALFTLIVMTGLRISEALSLNIGDLTDGRALFDAVTVQKENTKGKKYARSVSLLDKHGTLHKLLRAHLMTRRKHGTFSLDTPLFISRSGLRLDRINAWERWRKLMKLADIFDTVNGQRKYPHPHDGRHTRATLLIEQTGDLTLTAAALGHCRLDNLKIYTHRSLDDLHQVNLKMTA